MSNLAPLAVCRGILGIVVCGAVQAAGVWAIGVDLPGDASRREFFETKVRPIWRFIATVATARPSRPGGYRVDSREGLRTGGDSGPSRSIPRRAEESLLVGVLDHAEPGLEMPKKAPKLAQRIRGVLRTWVNTGAFDPPRPPRAKESASKNGKPNLWRGGLGGVANRHSATASRIASGLFRREPDRPIPSRTLECGPACPVSARRTGCPGANESLSC